MGQTRPSPRSDQKEQEAEEELGDVAEDSVGNETSRELQGKTPAAGSPAAESQAAKIGIPPPPLPPLAPPPSPFVVTFKGTVAVSLFAQDTMTATGTGGAALLGPSPIGPDNWLMGGDVRQTRISMNVRGPELLGATPLAAVELEMAGGNQITTVPAPPSTVVVRDAMGVPVGTANVPMFTSSAQGDESLLPRLRTAYLEMNWDGGTNVIRAGQYHNLLLAMVSASAAHPATLGYGAGQLGWRAPGLSYSHKFKLGETTFIDAAVQVNRNSWNDNAPTCTPGSPALPPATNCLPGGASLGEAGTPQFEGRVMIYGGLAESPFPHYAPTIWQLHVVGHWDKKDLSGINNVAPAGVRDSMTTYAVEAGGKVKLGPVLIAGNGWIGQNTGTVYGNLFQIPSPDKPDVQGMGAWGQIGLSFTRNFSLWGFAGIDRPNRANALAAGFAVLQNVQLATMFAYTNGPLILSLEWLNIGTTNQIGRSAPTATSPGSPGVAVTLRMQQPSFTVAYSF